jgi:hypothetical protein
MMVAPADAVDAEEVAAVAGRHGGFAVLHKAALAVHRRAARPRQLIHLVSPRLLPSLLPQLGPPECAPMLYL